MKILLVAGHGAGDPGACANGFKEAELTREFAKIIKGKLSGAELFDISKNMYSFLKSGGRFDFGGYDYVLEIHFNAGAKGSNDGVTTGSEVLLHKSATPTGAEDAMLSAFAGLGLKKRGIKRRDNLRNMNIIQKKGVPYALLEVCFIDDADDMRIYQNRKEELAGAVCAALAGRFDKMAKKELESVNDIVWELAERGIVSDKALWLTKLEEDKNAYWLARKAVSYMRGKNV